MRLSLLSPRAPQKKTNNIYLCDKVRVEREFLDRFSPIFLFEKSSYSKLFSLDASSFNFVL